MFEEYPKVRPELPKEYQVIYQKHYVANREGLSKVSSVTQKMESWMHKKVAADLKDFTSRKTTLEIGAGTLNHLKYEKQINDYDIVEPFVALFENSERKKSIRKIYSDISQIPKTEKYDRIISIATFEHLENLPKVVSNVTDLLSDKGTFRLAIPNEGTILWKMGWKFTSAIEFKIKYKLNYEVIMKHEHLNTANEIEKVLKYFFSTVNCKVFGLSKKFAFYRFYECKK